MQKIQIGEKPALDGLDLHQEVFGALVRLWVMDGRSRVGKLTAVIQENNQVLLSDVEVEAAVMTRWFPFRRLIAKWYPSIGTTNYRRRGIGTLLLKSLLTWCSENGVSEVFGTVVQKDLVNTPVLLGWYTRHGFEIRPPDGRCFGNAVHLVVWKSPAK
jgi:GNAT superfamily N-acetyltransferase